MTDLAKNWTDFTWLAASHYYTRNFSVLACYIWTQEIKFLPHVVQGLQSKKTYTKRETDMIEAIILSIHLWGW